MTREEARRLLERCRELRFRFPTSFGNPGVEGDPPEREELVQALTVLDDEEADELAARAWRLWMAEPRDIPGGRRFAEGRKHPLALYGAGLFALRSGDVAGSRRLNEQALAAADDAESRALAHLGLSRVALEEGDADATLEHALAARRAAEDLGEPMQQALLHLHAQALRAVGDLDGAARLFEQSLEVNKRVGDEGMAEVEQYNLGLVHVRRGDNEAAARYLTGFADDPLAAAMLAYAKGDHHGAMAWLEQVGGDLPVDDRANCEWLRERLAEA